MKVNLTRYPRTSFFRSDIYFDFQLAPTPALLTGLPPIGWTFVYFKLKQMRESNDQSEIYRGIQRKIGQAGDRTRIFRGLTRCLGPAGSGNKELL